MVSSARNALFDPATLARYVRPGPRYTSYPPATEFHDSFTDSDAEALLAQLERPGGPVSLYLHVPFCSSLCWYCACNVVISRDPRKKAAYVDALCNEVVMVAERVGGAPLAELSIGGGSPNSLTCAELVRVCRTVFDSFDKLADAELGVELDPRDTTAAQVDNLAALGFTRLSVGVQDFNASVQDAIHRYQTVEQTVRLIERARTAGFRSVNIDLVYGLPRQTSATFSRTLTTVLTQRPQRIAIFGYAHVPDKKPHQRLIEPGDALPNAVERAELLAVAIDTLSDAGYVRIGLDHFATPDDALVSAALSGRLHRNFQGYVVRRAQRLLGCGISGISDLGNCYWQNCGDIASWERMLAEGRLPIERGVMLSHDDQIRRHVITQLMCDASLDFADVGARYSVAFEEYFAEELRLLRSAEYAQLLEIDDSSGTLIATPLGCNLTRNIAMVFDRYVAKRICAGARFSPTL